VKQKTLNAQRPTSIIQWDGTKGISEQTGYCGSSDKTDSTLNAQRQSRPRFDLEDRLLEFSARVVRLVDPLPNIRAANPLAGQLLRRGTSPYGNHGEIETAGSRKDSVHKLKICLKETKEIRRWLRLAAKSAMVPAARMTPILSETDELIRIFFSSIQTAERNAK
jgi:four helix bundle protein